MIANDYGMMIKKCCGSCHNRGFDDQEQRCCLLTGKHVRGNAVCDDWSMSDGLKAPPSLTLSARGRKWNRPA